METRTLTDIAEAIFVERESITYHATNDECRKYALGSLADLANRISTDEDFLRATGFSVVKCFDGVFQARSY